MADQLRQRLRSVKGANASCAAVLIKCSPDDAALGQDEAAVGRDAPHLVANKLVVATP